MTIPTDVVGMKRRFSMDALVYWGKNYNSEITLCVCEDGKVLLDFCKSLNDYSGYIPEIGLWAQEKVNGYFFTRKIPDVVKPEDLNKNFMRFVEMAKSGFH